MLRDDHDHHLLAEDVAEETQRQRQHARQVADELDDQHQRRGPDRRAGHHGEVLQVVDDALLAEAHQVVEDPHRDGAAERDVDVRRRRHQAGDLADGVGDEDEQADRADERQVARALRPDVLAQDAEHAADEVLEQDLHLAGVLDAQAATSPTGQRGDVSTTMTLITMCGDGVGRVEREAEGVRDRRDDVPPSRRFTSRDDPEFVMHGKWQAVCALRRRTGRPRLRTASAVAERRGAVIPSTAQGMQAQTRNHNVRQQSQQRVAAGHLQRQPAARAGRAARRHRPAGRAGPRRAGRGSRGERGQRRRRCRGWRRS